MEKNYFSKLCRNSHYYFLGKYGLLILAIMFSNELLAHNMLQLKKISLDIKNVSLVDVLNKIKDETKYEIFYISSDVINKGNISITNNNISIEDVLDIALKDTNLNYSFSNNTIVIKRKESPQEVQQEQKNKKITIKGVVTDDNNAPLVGALIAVKGKNTGAISDSKGGFILTLEETDEIEVSYVGMKAITMKVAEYKNKIIINISLEKLILAIDDIVIVGYGTRKKELVTGAIEVIKGEELAIQGTSRLDEAIMGQTAGVFVTQRSGDHSALGEVTIRIRGNKGDSAPLLVIDGTPRFGTIISDGEMRLSDINPNDVESISILKDAAAAAIYGSRAANGVILVTTKRGSKYNKLQIRYNGKANFQQASHMPNFVDGYNFALLYNTAVENSIGTKNEAYTDEELKQIKAGSNPDVFSNEILENNLKQWGYSTSHSLSLSGGSKNISYYTSGSYTTTSGLYTGAVNDRFNYNLRLDADLIEGLTASFDIIGSGSSSKNSSYQTITSIYEHSPLNPVRWKDGSWASINGTNPLISMNGLGGYDNNRSNYNTMSARLNYDLKFITKGLNIYAKGVFDNNIIENRKFNEPVKLYKRSVDIVDGSEVVSYNVDNSTIYPKSPISMAQRLSNMNNMLLEAGFNYDRTFGKNVVSSLLIFNYQNTGAVNMSAENKKMSSVYPEFVGNGGNIGRATDTFNERASLVGRINYSYDTRYVVEASFRYDGSTKFHPDNRWGLFPTISGAWNLSNEAFFKNWDQSIFSKVKFRVSTGILGNDGSVADFSYLNQYYIGNQSYQIGTGLEQMGLMFDTSNVPNDILRWGKSKDYNIGTDITLFDNRLSVYYEYYWRFNTNDIRSTETHLFPPSLGTSGSTPYQNFGKTKTWGYDLSIGWRDTIGKDLVYSVDFMMSRSWDVTIDAGDESKLSEERRKAGKPVNSTWMYVSDGLFQNQSEIDNYQVDLDGKGNASIVPGDIKYKDLDGNKELGEEDKRSFEYLRLPDFAMNLKFSIQYKGIYINALFQGALNYKIDVSDSYTLENNSLPRFQDYHMTESWSPSNPNASYPVTKFTPSGDNNRLTSDYWMRDASYLRLRTLNIGYSLPARYLSKVKLTSLSLGLQASNLFTICSLDGMDPDTKRGYPITRNYGFTLSFGF